MSDSWDWVEKQTKNHRKRTIAKAVACIAIAWFIFHTYGMLKRVDAPPPNDLHAIADDSHSDSSETERPVEKLNPGVKNDPSNAANEIIPEDVVEVEEEDVASGGEYTEVREQVKAIMGMAPAMPKGTPAPLPEEIEEPSAEISLQAKRMLESLERKLKVLVETDFPAGYSSPQWTEFQSLLESARATDDPQAIIATTSEAEALLQKQIPDIRYQKFRQTAKGRSLSDQLDSLIAFRRKNPDHAELPKLEESLRKLPQQKWLNLAAEKMRSASPDESGFTEGWLPIAGAWQLTGNDAEAREAIRQAKDSIARMTTVERAIESTIDVCQHESFTSHDSQRLITEAQQLCGQVSHPWSRSSYLANLSGLARQLGSESLASTLIDQSTALIVNDNSKDRERYILVQRCRAAAWTAPPAQIIAMCEQMERIGYNRNNKLTICLGYMHAAMAAARHADERAFLNAMFEAETILASVDHQSSPNYRYTGHLATANMLRRRYRAALIVGNNIPDPEIRAPILFRVLSNSPQDVPAANLRSVLAAGGQVRYGVTAVAGYVEHQLRLGESLLDLLNWIHELPRASQRASAMAGIARALVAPTNVVKDEGDQLKTERPNLESSDELVQAAEKVASRIEDSAEAAFAWLQIARTSHYLGHTANYRNAVKQIHNRCFQTWTRIWDARPAAKRSYDGTYYYSSSSNHRKQETHLVGRIVACLRHLSELQTDLGDATGAMDTSLYLANAAGFSGGNSSYLNLNFLHLEATANRLRDRTGVGADSFTPSHDAPKAFARSVIAAWSDDIPGLKTEIVKLGERGRIVDRTQSWHIARAYGELAILYAERASIDDYRTARRTAVSEINSGRAPNAIKLMLALADAKAGELALAESSLATGSVQWFGDASRPRTELARALAKDGQWEKAMKQAQQIPEKYPIYRANAWEAVARARRKVSSTQLELQSWAESHDSPVIKIAILCGFALAAE